MTHQEREAICTICLMAAIADGSKNEPERARLREIFDDLDAGFSPALLKRVLLGQADLAFETARLTSPALRLLAYEMAVGVCDADGEAGPGEQRFLEGLRDALGIDVGKAADVLETGAALARLDADPERILPGGVAASGAFEMGGDGDRRAVEAVASVASAGEKSADGMVLKYAVLNAALELLPQSLATMAIVPLQMKMVYRIGALHGYSLDQGHVRELLATLGVGMTSQVLESYARSLFGKMGRKVLGKKTGKLAGKAAATATGAAMTFATTYALGQVAALYYGGGRTLDREQMKLRYDELVGRGQALYAEYRPQVEQNARTLDLQSVLSMARG